MNKIEREIKVSLYKYRLERHCKELNINSELSLEEIEKIAYNTNIVDDSRLQQITSLLDVIQMLKEVGKQC